MSDHLCLAKTHLALGPVALDAEPVIGRCHKGIGLQEQPIKFSWRSWDDDLHPWHGAQHLHISWRVVRHTSRAIIVGGADAYEVPAQALVAKVVFDLLEAALTQERRDRVDDRNQSLKGQPGRGAQHALFENAHVVDTSRKALKGPRKLVGADIAQ